MSKPRWIDGGVFRTLRTATRKRTLAVVVGPLHGSAEIASRAALRDALGDGDRAALASDARLTSRRDAGLAALWSLRQPGLVTTAVCDAIEASAPAELDPPPRVFGPDSKGLVSAYSRKDPFVVHLGGAASRPETLVLSARDRKALLAPDSRYHAFLRATFTRTVVFSGFRLDDPDMVELLDDVGRVFGGHVPPNVALIAEGTADPAAALRASMHYGMTVVEYPADMSAEAALAEMAQILEELEVPKPATGDAPRGLTELNAATRNSVSGADGDERRRFLAGYGRSWSPIKEGLDAPRGAAVAVTALLLGPAPEGKVPVALVKGRPGEGKTTFVRRLAWDLSAQGPRVFWRDPGVGCPDRYVPAEAETARAVMVFDDADSLDGLPTLLRQLAAEGAGKVRVLLAADADRWDRSGLDHRIRQHAAVTEFAFTGLDGADAAAVAARLAAGSCLAAGLDEAGAAALLGEAGQSVLDGVYRATRGVPVAEACSGLVAGLDAQAGRPHLRRGLLATAMIHQFNMSLGREHLQALLGLDGAGVEREVIAPADGLVVPAGDGAVRTPHPVVAARLVAALAPDEAARHAIAIDLLRSLPGTPTSHPTVFHAPSELIRALRQGPLAPLALAAFFEAGQDAARSDVLFWFDRGRAEADFQRWEAALAAFDQALTRRVEDAREKEHNAVVQANRARCLVALHKKREAVAAVQDGLRLVPDDASLLRLHEKLGGRRAGPGTGKDRRASREGEAGERGSERGGGPGARRDGPGGRRGPAGGPGGKPGGRPGPGGPGGPRRATAGSGRQGPRRPGDRPTG